MLTRRSFFASVAALIPALGVPVAARPKVIRLRDIEHEYDPCIGDMGRGVPISLDQVDGLDTTGYSVFSVGDVDGFPVYGSNGKPTGATWVGWARETNGKHFIAAVEVVLPKTPEEATRGGWSRWTAPGTGQYIFPLYRADGTLAWSSWTSFYRGPLRVNFEVPA